MAISSVPRPAGASSLRNENRAVAVPPVVGVSCQKRSTALNGRDPQVLYGSAPPAALFVVVLPKATLRPASRAVSTPRPSTNVNGPARVPRDWDAVCRICPLLAYVPLRVRTDDAVLNTALELTVSAPLTVVAPARETAAAVLASVRLL